MKPSKLIDLYVIILIMWLCLIIICVVLFIKNSEHIQQHTIINTDEKDAINEIIENNNNKMEKSVETMPENDTISHSSVISYQTRLTSFYANDGYGTGSCTGTGLCENDFQVNENGWYTYQGKLVLATATPYLLNYGYGLGNGIQTYRYYDEITLNIDGVSYQGIVLDSCGACMGDNRIDLFVSNRESVKDTIVEVVK